MKTNLIKIGVACLCIFTSGHVLGQKSAPNAEISEIVIKGKIGSLNPPQRIWIYIGDERWDSVSVRNGQFEYRKKTLLPAYGAIQVKYNPETRSFVDMDLMSTFFEPGEMYVFSETDSIKHATFTGSASGLQNQHLSLYAMEGTIIRQKRAIATELNAADPKDLQSESFMAHYERQMSLVDNKLDSLMESQVLEHPGSLVSLIAFYRYLRSRENNLDTVKVLRYLGNFDDVYRNSEAVKNLEMRFKQREKVESQPNVVSPPVAETAAIGSVAPAFGQASGVVRAQEASRMKAYPFELKDTLGYTHRLEDFKGKTLVMDFWFTGCKGCVQVARMLREQVKPAFAGDTSVVFIAVSLDINFLQWKKSIRGGLYTSEGQLNLFTNGMGGGHPIYRYYGFSGAPQLLVIDPEGYVVSKSVTLNGRELVGTIRETTALRE